MFLVGKCNGGRVEQIELALIFYPLIFHSGHFFRSISILSDQELSSVLGRPRMAQSADPTSQSEFSSIFLCALHVMIVIL